jgi:RNA polymerase sigma-70 factor (ECF subfamily)
MDPTAAESGTETNLSPPTDAIPTLERVYTRYLRPIYLYLYTRVGNQEDAEDLASETFLKAFRQLDLSRSEATIAAWLFTVAKTVLADHWRKHYRYGALMPLDDLPVDPTADTMISPAQRSELEQQVANILASLPQRHRRVLELRFLDGYSVQETARELGVTPGNAKVLQYRALAKAVQVGCASPPSSPASCAPVQSGEPGCPDPAA